VAVRASLGPAVAFRSAQALVAFLVREA
jgi:hypothetical protein